MLLRVDTTDNVRTCILIGGGWDPVSDHHKNIAENGKIDEKHSRFFMSSSPNLHMEPKERKKTHQVRSKKAEREIINNV